MRKLLVALVIPTTIVSLAGAAFAQDVTVPIADGPVDPTTVHDCPGFIAPLSVPNGTPCPPLSPPASVPSGHGAWIGPPLAPTAHADGPTAVLTGVPSPFQPDRSTGLLGASQSHSAKQQVTNEQLALYVAPLFFSNIV